MCYMFSMDHVRFLDLTIIHNDLYLYIYMYTHIYIYIYIYIIYTKHLGRCFFSLESRLENHWIPEDLLLIMGDGLVTLTILGIFLAPSFVDATAPPSMNALVGVSEGCPQSAWIFRFSQWFCQMLRWIWPFQHLHLQIQARRLKTNFLP